MGSMGNRLHRTSLLLLRHAGRMDGHVAADGLMCLLSLGLLDTNL